MIPILKGTAARLGLRKPTGVYRYRDGTTVYIDEGRKWMETLGVSFNAATADPDWTIHFVQRALGVDLAPWQREAFERVFLNARVRP